MNIGLNSNSEDYNTNEGNTAEGITGDDSTDEGNTNEGNTSEDNTGEGNTGEGDMDEDNTYGDEKIQGKSWFVNILVIWYNFQLHTSTIRVVLTTIITSR